MTLSDVLGLLFFSCLIYVFIISPIIKKKKNNKQDEEND